MSPLFHSILLLVPALVLGYAAFGDSQAESPGAPSTQSALQPGPQHAMLQALAGTWDAAITFTDPSGGVQRSSGTRITTKHSDFYTLDEFRCTLMGQPMVGRGINGYCPVRKQFFAYWADSMTPTPMTLHGDYDPKQRELSLSGECYGMSGKLEACRTVTRLVDDDHVTWAMFGRGPDGKELRFLSIEYTRKR